MTKQTNQIENGIHFRSLRIENTNLCKYVCVMCPREKLTRKQGIMNKGYKTIVPVKYDYVRDNYLHYNEDNKDEKSYIIYNDDKVGFITNEGTVEPVFGIIKEVLGFRRFSFRGEENIDNEWGLVCLAYNLKRMFNLKTA